MASLQYGSFLFPPDHTETVLWSEEPQYSEDNQAYETTKFTIGIQSVLTPQGMGDILQGAGLDPNMTPGQISMALRPILQLPRQPLTVWDEQGNVILQACQGSDLADDDGGPRPSVKIKFFSPMCWLIEFQVEVYQSVCSLIGSTPLILSHRWGVKVRYDRNQYATREVTGTLRVSKVTDPNPDALRSLVVSALPAGFIRESMSFDVESSGKALRYTFSDRQVYCTPPVLDEGQATDMVGSYEEGTDDGCLFYSQFYIKLEGHKYIKKDKLFQQGIKIALFFVGETPGGAIQKGMLEAASFRTEFETNSIEITCRVMRSGTTVDQFFNISDSRLTQPIAGAEANFALDPGVNGQWPIVTALAPLLQPNQICSSTANTTPVATQQSNPTSAGYDTTGVQPPVNTVASINTQQPNFSPAQIDGQNYHYYDLEATYVQQTFKYMLPTACPGGTGSPQIIEVAQPVWYKYVKWQAERNGDINPSAPVEESSDKNEVFVRSVFLASAPKSNADKQSVSNRIAGLYIYFLLQPPLTRVSGHLPYIDQSVAFGEYSAFDFQPGIASQ